MSGIGDQRAEDVQERCFTVMFEGDIKQWSGNPFHVETPFGKPHTIGDGNVFDERDDLSDLCDHLIGALKLVISDIEEYERVNNLAPNPGRKHCWDSVALAHEVIAKAEGR